MCVCVCSLCACACVCVCVCVCVCARTRDTSPRIPQKIPYIPVENRSLRLKKITNTSKFGISLQRALNCSLKNPMFLSKKPTFLHKIPLFPPENMVLLSQENQTLANSAFHSKEPIYFSNRIQYFHRKSRMFPHKIWPRCLKGIRHWQIRPLQKAHVFLQKNHIFSQKIPCIPAENLGSLPSENKTLANLVVDCQKPIYFSKRTLFFHKKSPMFV